MGEYRQVHNQTKVFKKKTSELKTAYFGAQYFEIHGVFKKMCGK